jgi:hypothetical protein
VAVIDPRRRAGRLAGQSTEDSCLVGGEVEGEVEDDPATGLAVQGRHRLRRPDDVEREALGCPAGDLQLEAVS